MKLEKSKIKIIEFDLTTICNAKCPLCFRNSIQFPDKYKRPFFRNRIEIVNQILEYPNIESIYLIGQMSEPTTHPDFLKIVEDIKRLQLKIKICTNGTLYEDDFWSNLATILDDTDEIWFSICGSTQNTHEYYRKNTNLENILRHAEKIREIRKIDCVKCIKFAYNQHDIESQRFKDIVKQFSKKEYLETCYPNPQIEYKTSFNYEDFLPTLKTYDEYIKLRNMADFYHKINRKNICCQSIFDNQVQIDAYGNVFPCYIFEENNFSIKWNMDYDDILAGKHNCCKFCNKNVVEYCNKTNKNNII